MMVVAVSVACCATVFLAASIGLWIRAEIDERRWRKKFGVMGEAVLWSMETRQDDGSVVVEMEAPQDQEGKVNHLPECPVDFRQVFSDCICDRMRGCEQRVIAEGDEQSLIAYSNGYNDALDDCIAAVREAIGEEWQGRIIPKSDYDCCGCASYSSIVDDATDAINVLREEKL